MGNIEYNCIFGIDLNKDQDDMAVYHCLWWPFFVSVHVTAIKIHHHQLIQVIIYTIYTSYTSQEKVQ